MSVWLCFYDSNWKNKGLRTTDYRTFLVLKSLSAVRAEAKIWINGSSTVWACLRFSHLLEIRSIHSGTMFVQDSVAFFTHQEWGPPLDWKQRDKEQAHIMINPLLVHTHMTTGRAGSRLPINKHSFRLYSSNKEKHQFFPFLSPEHRIQCSNITSWKFYNLLELKEFYRA